VCGPSTSLPEGFHTLLFCTKEVRFSTLGALASAEGGARNHAEWACLTGRRVAQAGWTPLHSAAYHGQEAAITALVAAKADVHATNKVRVGGGAGRGEGEAAWVLYISFLVLKFGPCGC